MRALLQRVKQASVFVEGETVAETGAGLLVFLGINKDDNAEAADYLIKKIISLRIFEDSDEKMNLSVKDVSGEILLVSQFTLYADCSSGNRPSYSNAMNPVEAEDLYLRFVNRFVSVYGRVKAGIFGAHMEVSLVNDGPVTVMLESR